jgi:hypothetical protein
MNDYQQSPLWKQAFLNREDGLDGQRNSLITAFTDFRKRVSLLVAQIHKDMPSLTVHDITHIDALWWTASEIAGPDYLLNPSEAFVLGGAFLLHDAAHCIAAYSGGIDEIRSLPEWKYYAAMAKVEPDALVPGSDQFQLILFEVLRELHPKQARRLAFQHWTAPGDTTPLFLLPHDELRQAFGDAIGWVAESHWAAPHELEALNHLRINPPTCLHPAPWSVDILKLAILLRTADAAHIDSERAPRFLFALIQPGGSSLVHWKFQSRMHEVKLDPDASRNDLCISGSAFPASEQDAWWMAYDASRMIDSELRAADRILNDLQRPRLAARSVAFSYSPEAFSRNVPTDGWQPVDTSIKITNIKAMVERFGGEKLYGKDPAAALREFLQNAVDAIHACRKLGGLGDEEGEIEVAVTDAPDGHWLHITDTGIGMSRYVLTEVLLDFGRSLWRSPDLRGEWSRLPATGFEAIGQFGIGFFSVFMLGQQVQVVTRRYEPKEDESEQWLLQFTAGTDKRPILRIPSENERLKRHGTRLSVLISKEKMLELCPKKVVDWFKFAQIPFSHTCARLAPALYINLFVRIAGENRQHIIKANDWKSISPIELLKRIEPTHYDDAIVDKFGHWSHLTELYDGKGNVAGRCAIKTESYPYDKFGIGVVKGLFAANVQGLAGVVFSTPQNDLARKTANPDVSLAEVQRWANEQKKLLLEREQIDEKNSALLARFGADHADLTFGNFGGKSLSHKEFIATVRTLTSIKVHDEKVTHDDDDDVLKRDFDNSFEADELLLELSSQRELDWLKQIDSGALTRDSWSLDAALESALKEAWGEVSWDESMEVVGAVNGTDIIRSCKVAVPKPDIDLFD